MATTRLMTADDLLALPDDGHQYELIEGVLHRMSPAGFEHSAYGIRIATFLTVWVDERDLGVVVGADTSFVFGHDPDTVRAPDVAFVRADRLPPPGERQAYGAMVPDLAVEIVSPTDRMTAVDAKIEFYLTAGVRLVWKVEPRSRAFTVREPGRAPVVLGVVDTLDGGDVLPGFRLPVADIFR